MPPQLQQQIDLTDPTAGDPLTDATAGEPLTTGDTIKDFFRAAGETPEFIMDPVRRAGTAMTDPRTYAPDARGMSTLLGMRLPEERAAQLRGFGAGAMEGAAALLNPIDTLSMLPLFEPAGLASKAARGAVRLGSGLLAGRGATRIAESESLGEAAHGTFETALGLAGVAAPGPKKLPAAATATDAAAAAEVSHMAGGTTRPVASTTAADVRTQRLATEAARTRGATARAQIAEEKLRKLTTPLSSAPPAGKAGSPVEAAVEKTFPLSARVSDPNYYGPLEMPIAAGAGAGRNLQIVPTSRNAAGKIKEIMVGDHKIDLSTLGGTKLTGDEIRDLVLGRGRLLARAKGKQLPANAIGELDRMGLEYRRTTADIEKLQAIATANPQELQQLLQGKYELGYKLAARTREILSAAATDESGQINPAVLLMLGRASATVAAGATGYAVTDDPEDKLTNAALAAFTVGFATTAIPSVVAALGTASGRGKAIGQTVDAYMYPSMLSRPATILRANMGAYSGAAQGVLTRLLEGRIDDAQKIIASLIVDSPRAYLNAVRNGSQTLRTAAGGRTTGGVLGVPLRLIAAGDAAVLPSLQKGGFTLEDAQRLTLAGPPMTEMGKDFVQFVSQHLIARLLVPFPRVGMLMVESPFAPFIRKDLTIGERVARGALTVGAGAAAYEYGGNVDPRLKPFIVAAGGPQALPVAFGLALSWAKEQDKSVWNAFMQEVEQDNPFSNSPRDLFSGSRAVPGIVSDAARVLDPEGRERRGESFAATRSRIPGEAGGFGRESLPVREIPRDIFGKELPFQRPPESALGRLMLGDPNANNLPTVFPHDNPTARALKDMGVDMQAPRGTLSVGGKDVPLPPDLKSRTIEAKGAVMERALTQLMATPGWQRLDPEARKDAVEQVRQLVGRVTGGEDMRQLLMLAIIEGLKQQQGNR